MYYDKSKVATAPKTTDELMAGIKAGTIKADGSEGLGNVGSLTAGNPARCRLGIVGQWPLVWLGGGMPLDNPAANPAGAAAVQAWVNAGAPEN